MGENDGFQDFCNTYELCRGKAINDDEDEESSGVGEFKVRRKSGFCCRKLLP